MHLNDQSHFDVAILGAGMSGTILAAVLARRNVSVVLIDPESHPRFAIGESTIPHTSLLMSLLAEQYDVPELDLLAHPDRIADHVCSTCGIKRSFGFAYHRMNEPYDHRNGLQFGTGSKDENHLFRQDIDAYLLHVAVRYGACVRLGERVTTLDIETTGVKVETDAPVTVHARYVVDGTGYRSCIAEKYSLRERPTSLRHHSRSLFTHMIDVGTFEEAHNPLSLPWDQTTLHHVFDGGWFWVIPFNNRPSSTNPLVSVGLTLDSRRFPANLKNPEQEFAEFLNVFPDVRKQFEDAKPVRRWISTDRLQYSSARSSGYRFCLMSHSSGFVDPLFSRGLINTLEIVGALVPLLLRSLDTDDFSEEQFRMIDALQDRVLRYNDKLVHHAFQSWSYFDLWNAWSRVWAFGTIVTEFRLIEVLSNFSRTHDVRTLSGETGNPVFSDMEDPDYSDFFARCCMLMEKFESGNLNAGEAASGIFAATHDYSFPVPLTVEGMQRAGWLKNGEMLSNRNLAIAREGYRWAIGNPESRDLFGNSDTFYRWRARQGDPHCQEGGEPPHNIID